ncbi:MAG: PDZ domain-containing protein [Clostridia bacterium]|nr:PDZ domain-containing protein [Clostridia bacterium]
MRFFKKISVFFTVLTLFFIINVSPSSAYASGKDSVYLGGFTAGFTLKTRGATIVGLTDVLGSERLTSPCKIAGINVGDVIISINGKPVNNSSEVASALSEHKSGGIVVEYISNGVLKIVNVTPVKDLNGHYKIGVFIRDDLQGIGTVTFIDNEGNFASLGHPVTTEKGEVCNVLGGNVYDSTIIGVVKGQSGKAGELKGLFIGDKPIGNITKNTARGMYGKFTNFNPLNYKKVLVGTAKIGKAQIISTVDGKTANTYDIEIVKTDFKRREGKNLVIKVCDENLISQTGGIVQGMSGSPIIQDGKIVGAVTHVFVNDSARGYGISVQNMLDEM